MRGVKYFHLDYSNHPPPPPHPPEKKPGLVFMFHGSKLDMLQYLSPVHTGKIWSGTYFWSSECTAKYWRNCELHPGMGKLNNNLYVSEQAYWKWPPLLSGLFISPSWQARQTWEKIEGLWTDIRSTWSGKKQRNFYTVQHDKLCKWMYKRSSINTRTAEKAGNTWMIIGLAVMYT